jgi:D-xylose transport system ATP-binding protein
MTSSMTETSELALDLVAIEKSFGGVHALRGADLAARPGEILGLCGENGAGKSTLLKILSGVYPATSYGGSVHVRGEKRRFMTTRDAEEAGIAIVHQELMLVPELSVAANLALGRENGGRQRFGGLFGLVDDDAIEAHARGLLAKFGVERDIDPSTPVGVLGIGLQQVVEIVRALAQDAKILVLDEPTAALTGKETDRLMEWLRGLRDAGTTCIYVSHRMDEIFTICDRITVLRDGKKVGTVDAKTTSADDVVAMMVGRTIGSKDARAIELAAAGSSMPVLELRDLSVRLPGIAIEATDGGGKDGGGDDRVRAFAVEKVSLSIQPGEVVAVCGAMGSGRTALLSTVFGCAEHGYTGSIRIRGSEVTMSSPRDAIAEGVALIPEDRKGRGLVLGMSVGNNLTLPPLRSMLARALEWIGFVDDEREELLAKKRIEELHVRGTAGVEVATLSGGNQQKVVIGKWLEMAPNLLLLDEPTRGVDVGAREEIYALLAALAKGGTAVLLASSDLPEVLRLAHRILVLRRGLVVAELDGPTATQEMIVTIATGASAVGQGHEAA